MSGNTLYASGYFTAIGGVARNYLAAIDTAGAGSLLPWNPNANGGAYVLAASGNTLYAGGYFTAIGDDVSATLARLDANGNLF